MTEKEKQQSGELYNAGDRELFNDRIKAKKLCGEYNAVECNDFQKRERILDRLLALRGQKTVIEPNFFCDYGYNIIVGDNFYANHNLVILDCAEVTFGDNVFIGPNCGFYAAEHPVDANLRNQGLESAKPISIGNSVWIGGGVNVIGGVTIGDNVVIGAGSVVTENIPSNCVAAGNPCRVVKTLEPLAASPAQAPEEPKAAAPENRGMNSSLRPAEPPRRKRVELTRVDEPMNHGGFPDRRK
ncbi:maltose acetyltransferase domain-containing protein [Ruminococcus flavefaciens]|uniref:maltose acetyltransferase domain-containing protein n=1 Tax=Ruminococcus flavefaciens TaxID=1265 RepID=UPI0009EA32A2